MRWVWLGHISKCVPHSSKLNNAKDIDTSFVLNYGKMATKLKKKLALKWPQKCCKGAYALKPILIDCPNIFFNMLSRRGDISRRIRPQKPKCLANPSDLLSNFSIFMKIRKKGQLWDQKFGIFQKKILKVYIPILKKGT